MACPARRPRSLDSRLAHASPIRAWVPLCWIVCLGGWPSTSARRVAVPATPTFFAVSMMSQWWVNRSSSASVNHARLDRNNDPAPNGYWLSARRHGLALRGTYGFGYEIIRPRAFGDPKIVPLQQAAMRRAGRSAIRASTSASWPRTHPNPSRRMSSSWGQPRHCAGRSCSTGQMRASSRKRLNGPPVVEAIIDLCGEHALRECLLRSPRSHCSRSSMIFFGIS